MYIYCIYIYILCIYIYCIYIYIYICIVYIYIYNKTIILIMRIHVKWVTVFVGTAGFFPEHFGTPPAKLPTVNQYPGLQPIPEDQPSSALKTWTNGWGEINGPEKFKGHFSYCEWWFFIMLKSEFLMVKSHEIPLKERWWKSRPFVFPKKSCRLRQTSFVAPSPCGPLYSLECH